MPPIFFYTVALIVYGTIIPEGFRNLYQTVSIPTIQYLNMFLFWFVLYLFLALENYFTCDSCYGPPSTGWNILYLVSVLAMYAGIMLGSVLLNYVEVNFLFLMEIYVVIFILTTAVSIMIHKRTLGPFRRNPAIGISASQR